MTGLDPRLQIVINIGMLATALAALIGLPLTFVKLWPLLRRGVHIVAAVETLPEMALELRSLAVGQRSQGETLEGQNGVLDHLTSEVDKVKQQVKNDHDSNLREDLDNLHGDVKSLHKKLDTHLAAPTTTVNVNHTGDAT